MIISDLYKTEITASSYNVNIDTTDITITVRLKDFNNADVTGKQVTLTCDKGYFTKNNSTSISGTSTKSINLQITNGVATATWTASEWGLCTFSISNNAQTQILVKGYKLYTDSRFKIRYNEEIVIFEMNWQLTTDLLSNGKWNALTSIVIPDGTGTVPDLRPPVRVNTSFNAHNVFFLFETAIDTDAGGILKYYNAQTKNVTKPLVKFSVMWRRK